MLENARKKAGKLGVNGLLVRRMKEPGTGAKVAQAIVGTELNRRGELVAIWVIP
ncbi:MAG TPA: hypothetical protein VMO47_02880 [Rhodothermales bacterium]|nr:hypothetical protein [Rhodothermales bacterium]